jgi:hypothetical protein
VTSFHESIRDSSIIPHLDSVWVPESLFILHDEHHKSIALLKTKRKLTGLNQNNLNYFDFRKAGHQKFD